MSQVIAKPIRHEFTTHERIVNALLLNAGFIDNLGLMHGKMGICIFFYHVSRYTNNKVCESYADEFLEKVHKYMTKNIN